MRRVMVLVLVALGCVLLTDAPAQACDRDVLPLPTALKRAGFVFSGTVEKVSDVSRSTEYVVQVDRVYEGKVQEKATVVSPATKADCGLTGIRRGDDVMFVAQRGNGEVIRTRSYEGTRPLTPAVLAAVRTELGTGSKPASSTPDPADEPVEMTVVDDSEPMSLAKLALPGAVLLVGGLVTLVLARLLGRRPAHT